MRLWNSNNGNVWMMLSSGKTTTWIQANRHDLPVQKKKKKRYIIYKAKVKLHIKTCFLDVSIGKEISYYGFILMI